MDDLYQPTTTNNQQSAVQQPQQPQQQQQQMPNLFIPQQQSLFNMPQQQMQANFGYANQNRNVSGGLFGNVTPPGLFSFHQPTQ